MSQKVAKAFRVVPFHDYWAVMKEGNDTPIEIFPYQEDACLFGQELAAKKMSKLTIYDENETCVGRISFQGHTYREKDEQARHDTFQVDYYGTCVNEADSYYLIPQSKVATLEYLLDQLNSAYEFLKDAHSNIIPLVPPKKHES